MDQMMFIYVLTFFASVSIITVFWNTFAEVAKAKEERMDADRMAGMRTEDIGEPIDRFVRKGQLFRLRITAALIPGVVLLVILILTGIENAIALVCAPIAISAIGSMIPLFYFRMLVKKRQERFEADILDFTLGIANALRSGMALPQALEKVGAQATGPMKEELTIVLREYRLGADLVMALERMNRRMPCEDIRLLVSAIRLSTETGGSLAAVLAEMAAMIRARRELFDKIKALTAEGRFEALVMSCAPIAAFFILYFQQPDLMRPLYTTGTGWVTITAVLALIAAGYFTIRKVVSIEV